MRSLRLALLAVTLLGVTTAAASGAQTSAPLVTVQEDKGKISVSGTPSAEGVLTRSFRLASSRPTPLTLTFLPGDLKRGDGTILDRRLIRIKDPTVLGATPQDYLVEISGLKRSGTFSGFIQVRSAAVPNATQNIPLVVRSERLAPPAIVTQTPAFALKRATSCDPVMQALDFGSLCRADYAVALTGPDDVLKQGKASLLLVRSDGSAVSAAAQSGSVSATPDGRVTLNVPDLALDPGHYVGRTRVSFGDLADDLDIPVTIDIRWKPWWPLLALIAGILMGRWQVYMQRSGNSLIDSADRLSIVRARNESLPDTLADGRGAVDQVAGEIWRLIELGQAEAAVAKLALLDRCLDVLERIAALAPPPNNPALDAKVAAIVLDVRGLSPDEAGKKLMELKNLMATSGGRLAAGGAAIDAAEIWRKVRTVAVLTASRPIQYLVLLLLLAGAGMKVLYLDGGATLGAEPLADLLALVTWGLSADVMSRTISSANPVPAK